MITNGFTYVAVLLLLAAVLVTAEKKTGWKFRPGRGYLC